MSKQRKKQPEGEGGAPGWVVTYGDMMSLLLTFFVLLLSFSTISEEDFKKAMGSLEGALSVLPKNTGVLDLQMMNRREQQRKMQQAAQKIAEELQIMGQDKQVKVEYDAKGGIKITFPDSILFDRGSADLKPESFPIIESVSKILGELTDVFVEIKGHTDNTPIVNNPRYRDNYDLSYYRSDQVMRKMLAVSSLTPEMFEITACGSSQPISTNLTEEGRKENRRVEIFVRGFVSEEKMEMIQKGMP